MEMDCSEICLTNNKEFMKKTTLKFTAVLLFAAGLFACTEKEEEKNNVPYIACPHGESYMDTIQLKNQAYLFNDSVPELMQTKLLQISNESGYVAWIIYMSDNNTATMYARTKQEHGTYNICNYPEFAKQWNVPLTGQKVYYEGTTFLRGVYLSVPMMSGYNMILTTFRKK